MAGVWPWTGDRQQFLLQGPQVDFCWSTSLQALQRGPHSPQWAHSTVTSCYTMGGSMVIGTSLDDLGFSETS